jgi:hypothetical protein
VKFMNEYDIDTAVLRHARHPVLGPAARFLDAFKDEVNAHSDGWPYWSAPVRSAAKLMTLIERGDATPADLTKALAPIKGFMTRRGLKAGMVLPKVA